MNKHTAGPWEVVDGTWPGFIEVKGPSFHLSIVTSATDLDFSDYMVRHADARLIASAPELLEALTLLLHEVDESAIAGANDYGWPLAVQKSRAAIAKATGAA